MNRCFEIRLSSGSDLFVTLSGGTNFPYASTVWPTEGAMDHPHPYYSRNSCVIRCVSRNFFRAAEARFLDFSSSSLLLSSLVLCDTEVYGPSIRAFLGTASQFCEVVEFRGVKSTTSWRVLSPPHPQRLALPSQSVCVERLSTFRGSRLGGELARFPPLDPCPPVRRYRGTSVIGKRPPP